MNDKIFISNLQKLKDMKPDATWSVKNRELLCSQINSSQIISSYSWFFYLKLVPQSVMVAVFVLLFVVSGGLFGLHAAENAVPGDLLYAAKISKEKTQQAFTFDDKNKARLGLEFASNRVEEINQVLASESANEEQGEKVEKLVVDFKKEISDAKARLEKISQAPAPDQSKTQTPAPNPKSSFGTSGQAPEKVAKGENKPETVSENSKKGEDSQVFGANLGKDSKGLDVYEDKSLVMNKEDNTKSSTTIPLEVPAVNSPQDILEQAKNHLNDDDIAATLTLINEADQVIEQVGVGQVKGESEGGENLDDDKATSTGESKNEK